MNCKLIAASAAMMQSRSGLRFIVRTITINIGDLRKAREYYEQALASLEASAAVRRKALQEDGSSPEQKAAMTKEELAKQEIARQSADLREGPGLIAGSPLPGQILFTVLATALVMAGAGPVLFPGMYPSAIAHVLRPIAAI